MEVVEAINLPNALFQNFWLHFRDVMSYTLPTEMAALVE